MALSVKVAPDDIRASSREWFDRVDSLSGYWALAKSSTRQLFSTEEEAALFSSEICNFDINISPTPKRCSVLPMKIRRGTMSLTAIW